MDPREYLASLGILDQGGYASPDLATPDAAAGAGAPAGQDPLTQARVLATLRPPGATGVQRFGAGLGAKTNKPPGNKWVAALDGAMSGFSGAVGANAAAQKSSAVDIASRMNLLKSLFGMDRQLANDQSLAKYRQDSLDVARERNRLGGAGHYTDPLVREKNIRELIAKHPAQVKLDEDDSITNPSSSRKLKPEDRKKLEDEVAAERKRLEGLTSVPRPSSASNPDAQDGLVTPIPGAPAPAPEPAPAPAPNVPQPPARPPQMTREQLIPAALEKIKQGVPMDALIGAAKEKFGVDLTPQDLGVPATPQPTAPSAPDPTAIESGNVPVQAGAAPGGGIGDILRSLFGGS